MLHTSRDSALKTQTQVTLEAMRAYFKATAQARPCQERQELARQWLAAVRRLRMAAR
ncbi:MAG: hypothetical protein WAT67_05335 [Candidatus Contendobacter sp.]